MNTNRVNQAIAIMERAKVRDSVYMPNYQTTIEAGVVVNTEKDLHICGNKACFAGHIAISPEFQADGGHCELGAPVFQKLITEDAIAAWLEVSLVIAHRFIFSSDFYRKDWSTVTAQDVIDKLIMLRDHGESAMLEYIASSPELFYPKSLYL